MIYLEKVAERRDAMRASGHWRDVVLTDFLDRWAAERRDSIAVVDHNSMTETRTELTFGELAGRVDRIAAGLAQIGIGRGDVISFQLPNWWQ